MLILLVYGSRKEVTGTGMQSKKKELTVNDVVNDCFVVGKININMMCVVGAAEEASQTRFSFSLVTTRCDDAQVEVSEVR